MIVTLTFEGSEREIVSGFPETVTITSSSPATIYYTLDGSLPTQMSTVYTEPIRLPTDGQSITLSAVGYFLDGYNNLVPTPVLSNIYSTDVSTIKWARYFFYEGIAYMYPGGQNIPFFYDSDGYASIFIDVPEDDLFNVTIPSRRDALGSNIEYENKVGKIPSEETQDRYDDNFQSFDKPTNDNFNPHALFILIDGRVPTTDADVTLINGPSMNLRDPRRNFGGIDFYSINNTNYRSANMARMSYDRKREIVVFHYYDTNNGRWVRSVQHLPQIDVRSLPKPSIRQPVVFKWFNFGRHQGV